MSRKVAGERYFRDVKNHILVFPTGYYHHDFYCKYCNRLYSRKQLVKVVRVKEGAIGAKYHKASDFVGGGGGG